MKKQFQSKSVPRGTRTIWRYLSAFILFFSLSITQMWADLTAHVPGVYEKTVATGGYGCTLTTVASGENAGTFEVYYFSAQSKYSENTTVYNGGTKQQYRLMCTDSDSEYQLINTNGTSAFTASCDWIEMAYTATGFSKSDYTFGTNKFNEFFEITPNGGNTGITKTCYIKPKRGDVLTLKVSGYVEFTILGNDNGSSKYMTVTVDGGTPTSWKSNTLSRRSVALTTGEHTIVVANVGTSANAFYGFSLKLPATPSCEDPETALSLSSDAAATVYVGDEITFSTSGGNGGTITIEGAASETISDGKWIATEGSHTFTASQPKTDGKCAQEDELVLTVNPKTPVTEVTVAGATAGYLNEAVTFTATAEYAASYRWTIDGVAQSSTTATMSFTPTAAGDYSIVCEARNDFNDPGDWIASSAHTYTASKLCGELIRATRNGKNIDPVTGVVGGTAQKNTQDNGKLGSNGHYWKLVLASGNFMIGDVVTVNVSTAAGQGTLAITTDQAGANVIATAGGVGVAGNNELTITEAVGNTIWLSRDGTNNNWNGVVDAIYVTRSCETSTDCSIKSLTINGDEITPAEKVYSYVVAAASASTEVEVAYTIHPLASGSPASGFNIAVPAAGDPANTQTITVTAEDGTHSDTYTVSVSKAAAASAVVTLDALGVTGYTLDPAFDAGTLAYTITKAYGAEDPGTDKVTFTKTEEAQDVDVAYDSENHKLTVTVTAEDNTTTQDYVITINEAEAPKSLSRVLFSNGFDAFIDNTNHTVKAYYLAGTSAPTATTITAGAGTPGEYAEGKITVTGADASTVDYIVTLAEVTPNTMTVAEEAAAGEFAGDEAWVKNGLLVYGNAAGYSAGDKWYVNRRLTKGTDPEDDQRVIAGWVRSYFFVGNASKFIMTVGNQKALKYAIDGGTPVEANVATLEIALSKGNHMIEIVSNQSSGDCRLSAPKLVELPPTYTVTYMPGDGEGAWVVDDDAAFVADVPVSFTAPEGKIFHGWKDGDNNDVAVGDPVTADMALTAQWIAHYAVTFNMQDHGTAIVDQDIVHGSKAVKPDDPFEIGYDFGGWYTEAACTNAFDFNTAITAATELFAKWTEFGGCTLLYPATSGAALNVGDNIDVQSGSKGGSIQVVGMKQAGSIAYDGRGLLMGGGSADIISVTLANDMDIDTKITVTLDAKAGGRPRGLYLLNGTGGSVKGGTLLGWNTPGDAVTEGEIETFSYTVEDADGLAGTNVFQLKRQNSTYIKCIKVESCGAAIVYHNVTSAVVPAGKGTVTLGASSVREGYTTTAEYTITDPLYEFVSWSVSGAGASVESATANPATITVGTADAVVTLNLQLIPVKFTVNYYDGETLMGSELVAVNENPTASEIDTDKRHYTFQGWAETDGGSVVDLNTITRTEATTVNLYAVYAPVACPASGTIFSMVFDDTKTPASTVKVAKNGGTLDAGEYATISGGTAKFVNTETSDKDAITTSGQFKLTATKEVMKIELECVLQEGDIIRVPDNSNKYVISTSDAKTGTYKAQTSSDHEFAVTAAWAGVDDIYLLYDGSGWTFTEVEVYRRPALTGASLADLTIRQGVIKTPELTLEPSADAIVTSQVWEIVGTPVNLTGAAIDPATGAITAGTLDDASSNGTITVKVTLNGSIEATCTATVVDAVVQQNVTKSTIWNWQNTGATANIELTNSTDPKRNEAFVLANVAVNNDADFESDKLVVEGQYMVRDYNKTNPYFQGQTIKFNATVAGLVRVKFSNTGGNPARELYINGVGTGNSSANATLNWSDYVEVPAGEVSMTAFYVDPAEGTGQQYIRIAEIEFLEIMDSRTGYAAKDLGTACYEDDAIIIGAKAYEVAGVNGNGYVLFEDLGEGEALEAGKPYLFESEGSTIYFCKKIGANHADEEIEIMGMIGTFTGTTLTQGDVNYCYFSGRHLWMVNDFTVDIPVPDHRCYVNYDVLSTSVASPAPAPGRVRMAMGVVGAPKTPTSVENVQGDKVQNTKLLINGQLFILRGEKMYDATGRLVK